MIDGNNVTIMVTNITTFIINLENIIFHLSHSQQLQNID